MVDLTQSWLADSLLLLYWTVTADAQIHYKSRKLPKKNGEGAREIKSWRIMWNVTTLLQITVDKWAVMNNRTVSSCTQLNITDFCWCCELLGFVHTAHKFGLAVRVERMENWSILSVSRAHIPSWCRGNLIFQQFHVLNHWFTFSTHYTVMWQKWVYLHTASDSIAHFVW